MAVGNAICETIAASGSYQPASGVGVVISAWFSGGTPKITDGTNEFAFPTWSGGARIIIDNGHYVTETGGANPIIIVGVQFDA